MTTTVMRHSTVGDNWIKEMCALNPVQRVLSPDTGQPTGSILTGPVRLAFCDSLMEAKPAMRSDPNSRKVHAATILFTPFTDMNIFWEEYNRICASDFSARYVQATGQYQVDNPFFDQASKAQYDGFTPGCYGTNVSSEYRPAIVDPRNNPVTDEKRIFPGVWAIVAVNSYASGKGTPRQGPRFGLQTVMLIGEDQNLGGGGGPDPRQVFSGVNVKPPVGAATFAQTPQGGPPPMQGTSPFAGAHGAHHVPQGAPPMQPGFAPPGAPAPADDDMSQFA